MVQTVKSIGTEYKNACIVVVPKFNRTRKLLIDIKHSINITKPMKLPPITTQ